MYCLYFLLTNYSCMYHEIHQYDHDMYVMTYVCMLRIYISQVSIRSSEIRYIYKVDIVRSDQNRCICKVQNACKFLLDAPCFLGVSHMMSSWTYVCT